MKKIIFGVLLILFLFVIVPKKNNGLVLSALDLKEFLSDRPVFNLDTLFILTNKEPFDKFFQSRISKFAEREIDKFALHFNELSDVVIIKDESFKSFDSDNVNWLYHNNGIITIRFTTVPFFRVIESTVLTGDGSFGIESRYYWFFGWKKIGSNVGVS